MGTHSINGTVLKIRQRFPHLRCFSALHTTKRDFSILWMILSDLAAYLLTFFSALLLYRFIFERSLDPAHYLLFIIIVPVFVSVVAIAGLYPGVGVTPVQELRLFTLITTAMMFLLATILFVVEEGESYSRGLFLLYWALALVLLPISRLFARRVGLALNIWGDSVVIIGYGRRGKALRNILDKNRLIGMIPVLIIDQNCPTHDDVCSEDGLPILNPMVFVKDPLLLQALGIVNAVIVPSEVDISLQKKFINEKHYGLKRVILISELGWVGGDVVTTVDFQGMLGLEVERNLLKYRSFLVKRAFDISLVVLFSPILFPLIVLVALMLKIDSEGPVFYQQTRLGYMGREYKLWKFRSMVSNADEILAAFLAENPDYLAEWEATHKIKNDPRITRIGKLLRKTSLDELPQLWNVIKGEMSLVGPRPIVQDEVKHYGETYQIFKQAIPGVSGLWQISGRNDMDYSSRVQLDEYYIRHWSFWLDIYILIRTVWVVVSGRGAY